MFAGHTDVVPSGARENWLSDPFPPQFAMVNYMPRRRRYEKQSRCNDHACERFIAQHPTHQGSVAFLITSDEEGMAIDGTQAVLKQLA